MLFRTNIEWIGYHLLRISCLFNKDFDHNLQKLIVFFFYAYGIAGDSK